MWDNAVIGFVFVGVPVLIALLASARSVRRRTSPDLGAFLGVLLGLYVGTVAGWAVGVGGLYIFYMKPQGIPFMQIEQGVLIGCWTSLPGAILGAVWCARWFRRLWKRTRGEAT